MDLMRAISKLEVKATVPAVEKLQLILSMLSFLYNNEVHYPKPTHVHDGQSFDFIIVGGGTAGCVLANRLTEANWTVLLIEAGGLPPISSDVPGLFPLLDFSKYDWNDDSINDNYSSQSHISHSLKYLQGKMLGGSSSLDLMLYTRGSKADFDKWAAIGNEGWSWNEILPYYIKSETLNDIGILKGVSGSLHGTRGPVGVTKPSWGKKTWKYFEALQENGRNILQDHNGYSRLGYSEPQFTINHGIRQSTAVSYIRPIKDRRNLFILYHSVVTDITINKDKVATGVNVILKNGMHVYLRAKKEVILSAGVINSPKILMLSGVGPKSHLEEFRIDVIHDNPYVGKNLHDTPIVIFGLIGENNIFSKIDNIDVLASLNTFPTPYILGFATVNNEQTFPDYQICSMPLPAGSIIPSVFCSHIVRLQTPICTLLVQQERETLFGGHLLLHSKSRGKVELQSRDPQIPVAIYSGYYSYTDDLDRHARYFADFASVVNTTYFQKVRGQIANLKLKECDHYIFMSHDYWKCYVLNLATTFWNYAGTCSMGLNDGVVDSKLKVKGIKNLRIVDASVIPTTLTSPIKATVVMIAEKASDLIKRDHNLQYGYDPRHHIRNHGWYDEDK